MPLAMMLICHTFISNICAFCLQNFLTTHPDPSWYPNFFATTRPVPSRSKKPLPVGPCWQLVVKESRLVNNNMQAALRTLSCKYDSNKGGVSTPGAHQHHSRGNYSRRWPQRSSKRRDLVTRLEEVVSGSSSQVLPTDMPVDVFQLLVRFPYSLAATASGKGNLTSLFWSSAW